MIKREWLEMIVEDIESLIEWSKKDPDAFNRVISEQEIRNLQELASNLVVLKRERPANAMRLRSTNEAAMIEPKDRAARIQAQFSRSALTGTTAVR